MNYKSITIAKNKTAAVLRRHPWIFSGAVKHQDADIKNGDVVYVKNHEGEIIATGHFQKGSIICRVLAFEAKEINVDFYTNVFRKAKDYRRMVLDLPHSLTDAYRLIHGEGDGLPGLIIDVYGSTAVVQAHSVGMAKDLDRIITAINNVFSDSIETIYNKSKESVHHVKEGFLWGSKVDSHQVIENGCKFFVNWVEGQKTGFFLDQRENRALVGDLSPGKSVLNLFAYTGGFSIYALANDAKEVVSVDISEKATALIDKNVALQHSKSKHTTITANVMEYLTNHEDQLPYDVIVVDPPAFAKNVKKRHNAIQAYRRLNAQVFSKAKKGAIILTFSCSQVVEVQHFKGAIVAAGIDSKKDIKIVRQLSQGGDHPVNLFHPEGHYLKGYMLVVMD